MLITRTEVLNTNLRGSGVGADSATMWIKNSVNVAGYRRGRRDSAYFRPRSHRINTSVIVPSSSAYSIPGERPCNIAASESKEDTFRLQRARRQESSSTPDKGGSRPHKKTDNYL
ncbi:hypothetical protein J6590_042837 [Homalodisca vitripennis]|nr:hypothetical protein J6590_042837 [Homalodisca vitripennis]